jgi:hypothetical protein
MDTTDQLAAVRAELRNRRPRFVAEQLGLAYDTVLRIRRGQCTPRYDTLHALYRFLFHSCSLPECEQAKVNPVREPS